MYGLIYTKIAKLVKRGRYDSVIFDVDSTLVTIEGLDFLGKLKNKGEEVKRLTKRAMEGTVSMREAMAAKMEILRPSYKDICMMGEAYIKNLTPGAKETVKILKDDGFAVWLITGNFQPAVGMLAKHLGIPKQNAITNEIYFDKKGKYLRFGLDNPLSGNGGKEIILKRYKKRLGRTVLVGDGSTDLEAKEAVDFFIGFGGVVVRPKVKLSADAFIEENDIKSVISYILNHKNLTNPHS